jgi:hypothetical protein
MTHTPVCLHCGKDPYAYVELAGIKVPVAVTCCQLGIEQSYQSLVETEVSKDEPFKSIGP